MRISRGALDAKWAPLVCQDCGKLSPLPDNEYALRRCASCQSLNTRYTKRPATKIQVPRSRHYYGVQLLGKEMGSRLLP